MEQSGSKPRIALVISDPVGIGPELTTRLLGAEASMVGDRRVLARGARVAGVTAYPPLAAEADLDGMAGPALIDLGHLDPNSIAPSVASASGGRFALKNFRATLRLAAAGRAVAVCFISFNKQAMRLAHPPYGDEISFTAGVLGTTAPASEFNVLDGLWNARTTSHVPLAAVAGMITCGAVLRSPNLTDASMRGAGFPWPCIAVPDSIRMPVMAAISGRRKRPRSRPPGAKGPTHKARSWPALSSCAPQGCV